MLGCKLLLIYYKRIDDKDLFSVLKIPNKIFLRDLKQLL